MALHPGTSNARATMTPLRRRPRERVAGGMFEAFTRVGGLRPGLMPEHLRRQLRILGASDDQLARSLARMRSLGDWPYVWEAEGDARAAAGDHDEAFAAYYAAQRVLITPGPLKTRLYGLAVDAYALVDQPPLERYDTVNDRGERIAGYLQLPQRPAGATDPGPLPVVLMLPGVTGTKEEIHAYAMPLLKRGLAVARIDHPVYGETEGMLDHVSVPNARHTIAKLAADPRIDPARIHVHGMSMGAHFALHAARGTEAASVTVICPPFEPGPYIADLPTLNLTAVQHMTGLDRLDDLLQFGRELTLVEAAPELTMPMRIFHGGRDRTIPVSDGIALARAAGGPTALTIYERDHHNCLEHLDEITGATLEFLRDPHGVCASFSAIERRDEAATVHVSDHDAMIAEAGGVPLPAVGALPLILRGERVQRGLARLRRSARTT